MSLRQEHRVGQYMIAQRGVFENDEAVQRIVVEQVGEQVKQYCRENFLTYVEPIGIEVGHPLAGHDWSPDGESLRDAVVVMAEAVAAGTHPDKRRRSWWRELLCAP